MEQVMPGRELTPVVMHPVASSNLALVGYSADRMELDVEFKDGSVYRYFEVPAEVFSGLMAASSKGVYLNTHVKGNRPDGSPRYRYVRRA